MTTIGVLALQGGFAEHQTLLEDLGAYVTQVRLPKHLLGIDGLIIPGGETTTFDFLFRNYALLEPIRQMAESGIPIWGTCAGLISLASRVSGRVDPLISLLDIEVERNAYGRQVDSFEIDIDVPAFNNEPFRAVFIRAPRILAVGTGVDVIAQLPDKTPVAVRSASVLGTCFHPELTSDPRFHGYFLKIVAGQSPEIHAAHP